MTQAPIRKSDVHLAGSGPKRVVDDGRPIEIVPFLKPEVEEFASESALFLAGKRDAAQFQGYRLRRGVYGQRQPDRQMVRVKVPGGILSAAALDAMGVFAEKYAPLRKGHITTRENFQFHHTLLTEAPEIMDLLGSVGLTTREACGNTVRNVTASPFAGVDPDEAFDPTPYLTAYCRYFVRQDLTQNLPRKWKTAFANTARDTVITRMHDLGFIPEVRVIDGAPHKGFKVVVGGGTSIMPRLAIEVRDWVPVEDYLRVAQALITVFNRADMLRKNRMMARVKVLIDRVGAEKFKALFEAEYANTPAIDPTPWMLTIDEPEHVPPPAPRGKRAGAIIDPAFAAWTKTNVLKQRQAGFNAVTVTVRQGDLTAEQFHKLADISRKYASGQARLTFEQNLVLRWVHDNVLYQTWKELQGIGLGEAGAGTITDVTSCPGTDSCKLGITSSMGLNRAISQELRELGTALEDPQVKAMHIKMSGCPNGCGQHHLANIGFHGGAVKGQGGQQIPAYEVFVGGSFASYVDTRYGQRVAGVRIPAKRTPAAVNALIRSYLANRKPNEPFNGYVDRVGPAAIGEVLKPFTTLEGKNLDQDWEKDVAFKVERGEGECAV